MSSPFTTIPEQDCGKRNVPNVMQKLMLRKSNPNSLQIAIPTMKKSKTTAAADIEVIQRRVRVTQDYSAKWYDGESPYINWSAFLMHLETKGNLEPSPRFKNNRK